MEVPITNDELEGTLRFIRSVDKESVAKFIINQNRAIEGLTSNNRELAKAYRESLKSADEKPVVVDPYSSRDGCEHTPEYTESVPIHCGCWKCKKCGEWYPTETGD